MMMPMLPMTPPRKKYRLLVGIHLGMFAACAVYISAQYSNCFFACLFLVVCAIAIEWMPRKWRQRGYDDIAILSAAACAYASDWIIHTVSTLSDFSLSDTAHINDGSAQGLARIILLAWILIPSRSGLLRPLTFLIAMELLLLSNDAGSALETAALSNSAHIAPHISAIFLSTLAVLALFFDSWLRRSLSANNGTRIRQRCIASPWQHLRRSIPLVCLIAMSAAWYSTTVSTDLHLRQQQRTQHHAQQRQQHSLRLDNTLHIGNQQWANQDPRIVAKYIPDAVRDGDDVDATDTRRYYLRALAVPTCSVENDGTIAWSTPTQATHFFTESTSTDIPQGTGGYVIRFPAGDNIILRPDGADIPLIPDYFLDSEGNSYLARPNATAISYRCHSGSASYQRHPRNTQRQTQRYTRVPPSAQQMFEASIPQLDQWRILDRTTAATAIATYLHQRCRYQIEQLPTPDNRALSALQLFLFGTEQQRIGHCQYFATAATLILRSCNIPARPVFGFSSTERIGDSDESSDSGESSESETADGSFIAFRSWHAHAWVEYLDTSGSWQRLDPTPPDYLRQRIDGYNPQHTRQHADPNTIHDLNHNHNPSTGFFSSPLSSAHILYTALACLALTILGIRLIRTHLRTQHQRNNSSSLYQQRPPHLYHDQQALLACAKKLGIPISNSSTLSAIVHAIENHCTINLSNELASHLNALYAPPTTDHTHPTTAWPIANILRAAEDRTP